MIFFYLILLVTIVEQECLEFNITINGTIIQFKEYGFNLRIKPDLSNLSYFDINDDLLFFSYEDTLLVFDVSYYASPYEIRASLNFDLSINPFKIYDQFNQQKIKNIKPFVIVFFILHKTQQKNKTRSDSTFSAI